MKRLRIQALLVLSLLTLVWSEANLAAGGEGKDSKEAPVVPPRQGKEETLQLFNGKDLNGWEGSPRYWKAEDGCLTGTADGTLKYNRFLTWRGGTLRNFELRVKVKYEHDRELKQLTKLWKV